MTFPAAPVERGPRVRAVAASISLAFLRLMAEGDSVRASVVLSSFQQFWNDYRSSLVEGIRDPDRFARTLAVTGGFDPGMQTQWCAVLVLVAGGVATQEQVNTLRQGVGPMVEWYQANIRVPADSSLWNAYQVARGVPAVDAGNAVSEWAFAANEGLGGAVEDNFGTLIDDLAHDTPATSPAAAPSQGCPPGYVMRNGACEYQAGAIVIPGITQLSARKTHWGWYVAGGVGVLAAFGLGWRIWKKRGRR